MAGTKNTHPHPPQEGPPAQTGRTRSLGQDAGPDASEPQQCARPPPPHPA
jgi:hypothetical protein